MPGISAHVPSAWSRRFIDLSGQKFGRLVATKRVADRPGQTKWSCRCSCGTVKDVRTRELRQGTTRSCGCAKSDAAPRTPIQLGSKFSRLLVLSYVGLKGDWRMYRCLCDCGEETIVRGTLLRNGQTKSCGCLANRGSATRALNRFFTPLPDESDLPESLRALFERGR